MSDQSNMIRASPLNNERRLRKGLLAMLVVVLASVVGLSMWRTWRTQRSATIAATPQQGAPAFRKDAAPGPVGVLSTTLGRNGFTPATISHAAGSLNLKVSNQSAQDQIVLRLSSATGEKLSEVTVSNRVHAWVSKFNLGPGTYTLSEINHPRWTCQISVVAAGAGG